MPTEQIAVIIAKALQPETATSQAFGSRVDINTIANRLQLTFETNRTSTIRAVINSYLRWIMMITRSIKTLKEEKKT